MKKKFEVITSYTGMTKYIVMADSEADAENQFSEGYYESYEELECDNGEEVQEINEVKAKEPEPEKK